MGQGPDLFFPPQRQLRLIAATHLKLTCLPQHSDPILLLRCLGLSLDRLRYFQRGQGGVHCTCLLLNRLVGKTLAQEMRGLGFRFA